MNVRIKLTRKENLNHYGVSSGHVLSLDLEAEYLPCCVSSEVYEGNSRTPMEAKKAQAIAARTYIAAHMLAGTVIDDTATYQAFRWKDPSTIPNCVQACRETAGQVLLYDGQLITAWYSNSNGGRTKRSDEAWSSYKPWTVAQNDPWDVGGRAKWGEVPASHSVGMSQIGAAYAASTGIGYKDILRFYYPGAVVAEQYGEEVKNMVEQPKMGVLILEQNDCYTKGRRFTPKGIVVHSTGANNPYLKRYVGPDDGVLGKNQYGNHWNKPGFDKCGNAFIGKVDSGEVMIYQTLPWDWRPWLCGKGAKGTYNDSHIQFEMCEDGLTNEAYWRQVRAQAVHLCAWLCQEYGIDVANVVGHYEAAQAGYANNHGDPQNWMKVFGDSMALFREDVRAVLNGGEVPATQHYIGTVKTKTSGEINIRVTPSSTGTIAGKVKDGEKVEVVGNNVIGTFAPVKFFNPAKPSDAYYVDTQYLVDRVDVTDSEPDGSEDDMLYTITLPAVSAGIRDKVLEVYPDALVMEV